LRAGEEPDDSEEEDDDVEDSPPVKKSRPSPEVEDSEQEDDDDDDDMYTGEEEMKPKGRKPTSAAALRFKSNVRKPKLKVSSSDDDEAIMDAVSGSTNRMSDLNGAKSTSTSAASSKLKYNAPVRRSPEEETVDDSDIEFMPLKNKKKPSASISISASKSNAAPKLAEKTSDDSGEKSPVTHKDEEPEEQSLLDPVPPPLSHSQSRSLSQSMAPPPAPEEPQGPKSRLTIHKMALVNFKSYAGRQEIGPFHKVRSI
jgi:structural maintenance of chromosome 4